MKTSSAQKPILSFRHQPTAVIPRWSTFIVTFLTLFSLEVALGICSEAACQTNTFTRNLTNVIKQAQCIQRDLDLLYAVPNISSASKQSPINILSHEAIPRADFRNLNIKLAPYIKSIQALEHTLRIDFVSGSEFEIAGVKYSLQQGHFHTPAEHQVDGITYPLEMHVVSTAKEESSHKRANQQFLVIGILFRMSKDSKLLEDILKYKNREEEISPPVRLAEVTDMLSKHSGLRHFYHYEGSLTTHPYTESVLWMISSKIYDASPLQIQALNEIEGDNARHIHTLNTRSVYFQ